MAKALANQQLTFEQDVKQRSLDMRRGTNQGAIHLAHFAIVSLKCLILRTESDSLRLSAIKTLLDLPPIQTRLGAMSRKIEQYHTHQHVHVEGGSLLDKLTGLLDKGDSAQVLEILAAKTDELPANPQETNENP